MKDEIGELISVDEISATPKAANDHQSEEKGIQFYELGNVEVKQTDPLELQRELGVFIDSNYSSPNVSEIKHVVRMREINEIDRRRESVKLMIKSGKEKSKVKSRTVTLQRLGNEVAPRLANEFGRRR